LTKRLIEADYKIQALHPHGKEEMDLLGFVFSVAKIYKVTSGFARANRSAQPGHSRQRCVRPSGQHQSLDPGSTHLHWPCPSVCTQSWRLSCAIPRGLRSECQPHRIRLSGADHQSTVSPELLLRGWNDGSRDVRGSSRASANCE